MSAYSAKGPAADENMEEQFNSWMLDNAKGTNMNINANVSGSNVLSQALQDHLSKAEFDMSPNANDFKHAFLRPQKEGSSVQVTSAVGAGGNIARKLRNQGAKKTGGTGGN